MQKLILCAVYCGSGLVLLLLCWPLILRKIPPNAFYGFRVKQTMQNRELWYDANALAGKRLAAAGFFILVGALGFYFVPNWRIEHYSLACLLVTLFSVGHAIVESFRFVRSHAATKTENAE